MQSSVLKFSIDDIERYRDDDDFEFALMKLKFLSDGYNTHGLEISNEVLRKCASSIKGRFVVAKYDERLKDARGHNRDEHIVGIIPKDAEVTFEETANGTFACVDAIISKLYATEIVEMFKDINHRAVSVEMLCAFSDVENKVVESFKITAVTILGVDVAESCKGASCEVIKFSEERAEKCYSLWEDKLGEDTYNKAKEESMSEEIKVEVEETATLEEEPQIVEEQTEEMTEGEPQEAEVCETEALEEEPQQEEEPEEAPEPEQLEDEPQEEGEDEPCECEEVDKCATCEKCAKFAEEQEVYLAELSELREFKAKVLEERKDAIVVETLSKAKNLLADEEYAKYEEAGKACDYEAINGWRNEVLASVALSAIAMSEKNEEEHLRMELPQDNTNTNKSLWS